MLKLLRKNQKGFTLVELLVVIAIIGILAAVIAPNAFRAVEKGKTAAAESDFKALKSALLNYYTDTGVWPDSNANDPGLVAAIGTVPGWNGPYLERWPARNPWGGTYTYVNGTAVTGTEITTNYKYIQLSNIDTSARDRLEADLDGGTADNDAGVVRYTTGNTVYLVISTQ
jgi:general secretion pathway protein G